MFHRARLAVQDSRWGFLVIFFAVILIPAQLCRYHPEFPFPFDVVGRNIRLFWGSLSPSYEHFFSGLGIPLGFGCFIWLLFYTVLPLANNGKHPSTNLMKKIRVAVVKPSKARDYLGMLLFPIVYPSYYSWDWEICQAHNPLQCIGGNGDGTIQYCQIALDHIGIVVYLVVATIFVRRWWLPSNSAGPARTAAQHG